MGETIEQLRDELAGLTGWEPVEWCKGEPGWFHRGNNEKRGAEHPFDTLDRVAAHGLPEGWRWSMVITYDSGSWWASVVPVGSDKFITGGDVYTTELHARLAACVSAWKAQAERSGP